MNIATVLTILSQRYQVPGRVADIDLVGADDSACSRPVGQTLVPVT